MKQNSSGLQIDDSFYPLWHCFGIEEIVLFGSRLSNGKLISLQAWTGPQGSERLRIPGFLENRHMKVVILSTLHTDRLYLPGDTHGIHFCQRLSRNQRHSAARRMKSMKNSQLKHLDQSPRHSGLWFFLRVFLKTVLLSRIKFQSNCIQGILTALQYMAFWHHFLRNK